MTKTLAAALAALILTVAVTSAQARTRHSDTQGQDFDRRHDLHPDRVQVAGFKQIKRKHDRRKIRGDVPLPRHAAHRHKHGGHTASLDAVVPKLAAKARELIDICGAKVISAYRPGARVRGYGTPSLHSRYPSEAIDMIGDRSCIYPKMKGWPGGYSVDYAAVQHIHISLAHDRRERGARFAHYGTRRYARAR